MMRLANTDGLKNCIFLAKKRRKACVVGDPFLRITQKAICAKRKGDKRGMRLPERRDQRHYERGVKRSRRKNHDYIRKGGA